ncbi:unnamed protein product [Rangifer tarandus platyrhynchus]|uniref:Uncharacterized protein n=1 Tax=Rangifer tarandus platyrhynchus TaxID=3082113 RepID=A0ABN8YAI4_RANTA|nr:unnamed protein product [Rangifer tarandus platyrhynchus]
MVRAAAGRPAASAAGQERSPRPPSGCGGQSSGDSARPGADLSQLACAAQLSNIHLRGSSPVAPFQESGKKKKIPSGGLSGSLRKASWGAAGRGARDWPADPPLCSDQSSPRGPVAPRGKGGSGGLLRRENPRHGRLRLRGARDGARTGVRGRVTEPRWEYTPERPERRSPRVGVGGILVFTRFFRGGGEGSEVWGFSSGEEAGRRPSAPAQVQALSRSRTPGKWGHGVPGNSGPGSQPLPGSDHSQSSDPPVPRPKRLLQTIRDKNTLISLSFQALGLAARSAARAKSGVERAARQLARRPHPCAGCCCSL